jgi:hypothetical protein
MIATIAVSDQQNGQNPHQHQHKQLIQLTNPNHQQQHLPNTVNIINKKYEEKKYESHNEVPHCSDVLP